MTKIKSLLNSLQGVEYPASDKMLGIPLTEAPLSAIQEVDSVGLFFDDLKEQLELLQRSLDDDKMLSILYTSRSGQSVLVDTITLSKNSDLAVLSGIDLLDDNNCVVLCHIKDIEIIVKAMNKHTEKELNRQLGFKQIAYREAG